MFKRIIVSIIVCFMLVVAFTGCTDIDEAAVTVHADSSNAKEASAGIVGNQPVPTDIEYSLERYNVIRRAYWVNGQREKAAQLVCQVVKPLGYITLFSDSGAIIGTFVVDGKVSSLNSYLFPAYEQQNYLGTALGNFNGVVEKTTLYQVEIPGIDGCYGSNVTGIFFFTIDGNYIEWSGKYLYSDIPMEVENPVIKFKLEGRVNE